MAIPTKTFADLRQDVLDACHGKPDSDGTTTILDRLIKRAARETVVDVDLRSTKRSAQLSLAHQNDTIYEETDGTYDLPTLQAIGAQADDYQYACPNDLKGTAIVDIQARTNRIREYFLTTPEEFDRRKLHDNSLVAFSDKSWVRKILATGVPDIDAATIHNCDTYNGNGTFTAVGGASSVASEATKFVQGVGAVTFNSDLGTATAGIQNTTMTAVDLSAYEDNDLFVWVYIPDATLITSFTFRWGSDSSNYWSDTVTQTHDQLAFYAGWNLLRFDWSAATETGSPDSSAVDFVSFFMTKDAAKTAATGWIVDGMMASINSNTDVVYYSKYPWQTSTGSYLENSTADTDLLNADTDEYSLFVNRAAKIVSAKLGSTQDVQFFDAEYANGKRRYILDHPSEAKIQQTTHHRLASLSGSIHDTTD